jgi:hypothetical protein
VWLLAGERRRPEHDCARGSRARSLEEGKAGAARRLTAPPTWCGGGGSNTWLVVAGRWKEAWMDKVRDLQDVSLCSCRTYVAFYDDHDY